MPDWLGGRYKKDDVGVWVPQSGPQAFGYSDGAWVERYLENVFRTASDLSSASEELETHIKDWNTEYHLSRKRKDLLAGLRHDRSAKVLEIGCGCGAITRFLGESYDSVVAVEGSYKRARLARLRTADLPGVEVVSSRYQDIGLEGSFDIVFCIGVLEYAPSYVDAADPFAHALDSMKRMLKPGGALVIAIENKFGLKYFANSREDHAGTFFEGIEGYPRTDDEFETFGRKQLAERLGSYWPDLQFYYPFPDYKMPSMLLSEAALEAIDIGEMLASLHERDYAGTKPAFFDNRLAWREVARNGLVGEFSNSFLVVAGSSSSLDPDMADRLAVLFNRDRRARFSTETSISRQGDAITVAKTLPDPAAAHADHLRIEPIASNWIDQPTIAYSLFRRAHGRKRDLPERMTGVIAWWDAILTDSSAGPDGPIVPGRMIDAVWHNACHMVDGTVQFFDQELVWHEDIPAHDLFLRAAFAWCDRYRKREMPGLGGPRMISAIRYLARAAGLTVSLSDMQRLARREALIQSEVGTISEGRARLAFMARIYLPYCPELAAIAATLKIQSRRARNLLRRIFGR